MTSATLLGITTIAYLVASGLYVALLVFRVKKLGTLATGLTAVAFLVHTAGIAMRWIESYRLGYGHPPLSNMYESLVFFSWATVIFYFGLEFKFRNRVLGAFAIPFAFLSMALASMFHPDVISPLVPALQSNWLFAHVMTCFVGYAAFAVASGLGVMYLVKTKSKSKDGILATLPELRVIDDIIHKTLIFGFLWLSAGIITGAIWANSAWGTYWSWDPKETWSLITWFIYAAALHARFTKGWGGTRIAWLAIIGFLAVIFTYYGVNFLLSGLHSYGAG